MRYTGVIVVMVILLAALAVIFWGIPYLRREKPRESMVLAPPPAPGPAREPVNGPAPEPSSGDPLLREPFGGVRWPVADVVPGMPRKEHYGEPPGNLRAIHHDELGFRGWADMPGEYEGSSASALSAFIERSA